MRTPVKDFRISAHGIFQVPKTAKWVLSRDAVSGVQLKWHNFGPRESFPMMCFLVSFGGRRMVWAVGRYNIGTRKTEILAIAVIDYAAYDVTVAQLKTSSLKIQDEKNDAKKSPSVHHIAQICRSVSSQPRHVSTIGKNLLNGNMSSICPRNILNFGLLTLASLGHPR